ncbi:MAG: Zn-dependent hydrolase, partial [Syntrophomonadaceae bacterium]|nr:Zn-dependent hydrolase [Syntrophomonadaceae bacterium]
MAKIIEVCNGVYQVGGNRLSFPEDCCVYLVKYYQEAVLIDTGAGKSADFIIDNMEKCGIGIA